MKRTQKNGKKSSPRSLHITQEERESVSPETKALIKSFITKVLDDPLCDEVTFPSYLNSIERKLVHTTAQELGLSSKSRGNEPNRVVKVFKPATDTTQQNQPPLTLSRESLDLLSKFLAVHPVDDRDHECVKHITNPPTSTKPDDRKCYLTGGKPVHPKTDFRRTQSFRQLLPISAYENDVKLSIDVNRVSLIVGDTGSGKTTQVPQIILEHAEELGRGCQIICSLPRRVACITVSDRVAFERGEPLGQTVGYKIRFDARISSETCLTFCTNGVLLRSLLSGDEWLKTVTHVILDEVHERDKLTDYNMIILKEKLAKFKNLKLILMSATVDSAKYESYFDNCPFEGNKCNVVRVPGRMFLVREVFLEEILQITNYSTPEMETLKKELSLRHAEAGKSEQGSMGNEPEGGGRSESKSPTKGQSGKTRRSQSIDQPSGGGDQRRRSFPLDRPAVAGQGRRRSLTTDRPAGAGEGRPTPQPDPPTHLPTTINVEVKTELHKLLEKALDSGTTAAYKKLVGFMTAHKISVNYQHPETGRTALMGAMLHGNLEAADEVIHLNPDVNVVDNEGKSALTFASETGNAELLDLMDSYMNHIYQKNAPSASTSDVLPPAVQEMIEIYEMCHMRQQIDEELILSTLKKIHSDGHDGAVLIFLPGYEHIMSVKDKLQQNRDIFKRKQLDIHILHSMVKVLDQKKVFEPAPVSRRKVVLSTNIAENSVTISDVRYVIDCGKVKEMTFNSKTGCRSLECNWISRACAEQRKGRAGRTSEGIVYRLYSKQRFMNFNAFKVPDLLREPIADLCLQAKMFAPAGSSISDFLERAIDPPPFEMTLNTIRTLKAMGALTENEELTALGQELLRLPVDPHLGKMIITAILLRCLDPVLTIVCCLSSGEVFKLAGSPEEKGALAHFRADVSKGRFSDHLVYLNIFRQWESAVKKGVSLRWCQDHMINAAAMETISGAKKQILSHMTVAYDLVNANERNFSAIKAALASGLYPNVAKVDTQRKCVRTPNELKVVIHPSSVVKFGGGKKEATSLPSNWLLFEESHQGRVFTNIRTCTVVSPLTIALFTGPVILPAQSEGKSPPRSDSVSDSVRMVLDDFITLTLDSTTAQPLQLLRCKWYSFMDRAMQNLGHSTMDENDSQTLSVVLSLLENEDQPRSRKSPIERVIEGTTYRPTQQAPQSRPQSARPSTHGAGPSFLALPSPPKQLRSDRPHTSHVQGAHADGKKSSGGAGTGARMQEMTTWPSSSSSEEETAICPPPEPSPDHREFRYFIIRKGSWPLVRSSWESGTYPVTAGTFKKLMDAMKFTDKVCLIFWTGSQTEEKFTLQGYAKVLGAVPNARRVKGQTQEMTHTLQLKWVYKGGIPLRIRGAHDPLSPLLMTRDGDELAEIVAKIIFDLGDNTFQKANDGKRFRRNWN